MFQKTRSHSTAVALQRTMARALASKSSHTDHQTRSVSCVHATLLPSRIISSVIFIKLKKPILLGLNTTTITSFRSRLFNFLQKQKSIHSINECQTVNTVQVMTHLQQMGIDLKLE